MCPEFHVAHRLLSAIVRRQPPDNCYPDSRERWDRTRHSSRKATGGRVLGESDEFRKLHRAADKAHGDREGAIRNVYRLYGVKTLDALPGAIPGGDVGASQSARLRVAPALPMRSNAARLQREGRLSSRWLERDVNENSAEEYSQGDDW